MRNLTVKDIDPKTGLLKPQKCAHRFLGVRRRASGIQYYTYDTCAVHDPWTFGDDQGDLSVPKFGTCEDCGEKVRLPESEFDPRTRRKP